MRVTHLVDSNDSERNTLAPGDKVRVKARDGLYVVLRVDREESEADLLRCEVALRPVDRGVPLSLIQPVDDYLPELFRWYIESAPARHGRRRRLRA